MADATEMNRYLIEIQQEYVNFLDDSNTDESYITKIKEMIAKESTRLVVNINDLREKNLVRCNRLLTNGFEEMPQFQKALREVVASVNTEFVKIHDEFYIGLEGSFGAKHVNPRSLTSHFLGNTVCVEGIVTKCSLIRPKVVRSVHYCPATHKTMERRYADASSFDVLPSVSVYPTKDDDGNLLETEYGLSRYRDHQTITIQEMPEKAPTGQLPRSLDISLDNDLVDICKPGDRVLIVGVYRCLPGKQGGFTTGIFKSILLGSYVTLMHKDVNFHVTDQELREIRNFPKKNPNAIGILSRSLAPSIHGHEFIKRAVLCLLLGGVEKTLPNGTRLRGDINCLLIGDPSVAKSQMLRYVANVAPRVVMTTGRGSSGVGLTAAVTTDMETGDRRLEAGAMVLADRGIVCIDEFDKMSDADRTAIHEVMEQGRVTIAKAGIHARLNARTAVLAAANPVYGRYDEYRTPMENIGLQDSLLSRFDLLFVILDTAEPEKDRLIADHVLRMHRYRNPTEQDGEATSLFDNEMTLTTQREDEDHKSKSGPMTAYEKHDPLLHGKYRTRGDRILSMEFVKKYIHVAKQIKPQLTSDANRVIVEEYTRIRSNPEDVNMARTQPITPRCLETLIRLATAHAKARLSIKVEEKDAHCAIELLQFAIFKKVLAKKKKRRHDSGEGEDSGNEEMEVEDDVEENEENGLNGTTAKKGGTAKRPRGSDPGDDDDIPSPSALPDADAEADSEVLMDVDNEPPSPAVQREISDDAYVRFKNRFTQLFEMEREESLTETKVVEWLTASPQNFTEGEVLGGLDRLTNEGKIMISEGIVFLF